MKDLSSNGAMGGNAHPIQRSGKESRSSSQLEATRLMIASLNRQDRAKLLDEIIPPASNGPLQDKLIRRAEAANLLACHPRTIDNLAGEGTLKRVRLPGRKNAQGYRLSDVNRLIEGGSRAN